MFDSQKYKFFHSPFNKSVDLRPASICTPPYLLLALFGRGLACQARKRRYEFYLISPFRNLVYWSWSVSVNVSTGS